MLFVAGWSEVVDAVVEGIGATAGVADEGLAMLGQVGGTAVYAAEQVSDGAHGLTGGVIGPDEYAR